MCLYVLRACSPSARLSAHGACKRMAAVEGLASLLGQDDELRPAVMRVGLEYDETVPFQVVDDPLHVLTAGAEISRQPRDGGTGVRPH